MVFHLRLTRGRNRRDGSDAVASRRRARWKSSLRRIGDGRFQFGWIDRSVVGPSRRVPFAGRAGC